MMNTYESSAPNIEGVKRGGGGRGGGGRVSIINYSPLAFRATLQLIRHIVPAELETRRCAEHTLLLRPL